MSKESTQSAPVRILVAEDEALIRMDLVEMLQEAGYEVIAQATNGEEAIALATEHKPDLAILDVKMPVLDGISAAEKIISIAPVLMLTAFSQKELIDRARDAGVMAGEVWLAAEHESDEALAEEISQLIYHLQTLMLARGLTPDDIYRYL